MHNLIIRSIVIVVIKRRQLRTSAILQSAKVTHIRRSYDKEVMTRLFSYCPYIKPSVDNCPWLRLGQLSTLGLDIRADMKTAV